ncbi:MAG: diacylglycerol kinase [bacterium]|nr:diacylglycerol kinase [bacterium]
MDRLTKSFSHAFKGILFALRNEKNFQIDIVGGTLAVMLMLFFPLSGLERALIILSISLVLTLELINTGLERVTDILKPRIHPYARVIKDVMAGAVLLVSLAAIAIGVAIFVPYLAEFIRF